MPSPPVDGEGDGDSGASLLMAKGYPARLRANRGPSAT